MSEAERKLTAALLKHAGELLARRSCNDFDLARDAGLSADECAEIMQTQHQWCIEGAGDEDDPEPEPGATMGLDWLLMYCMADRLTGKRGHRVKG